MTTPNPGRYNDARWLFQSIQGMALNADLALQRGDLHRAIEEKDRIGKRLQQLAKELGN